MKADSSLDKPHAQRILVKTSPSLQGKILADLVIDRIAPAICDTALGGGSARVQLGFPAMMIRS